MSLMAPYSSFVFFSRQLHKTYSHLPCLDSYVWQERVEEPQSHWYVNDLYSDSKTDTKLWCDIWIKFQLFEGAQDFLLD